MTGGAMKPRFTLSAFLGLLASLVSLSAPAQDKITQTPSLMQEGFGPGGYDLIGDGSSFCGATTTTMSLAYLASVGFTQILPENPVFADYLQLEQNIIGLSGSSQTSGVTGEGLQTGVETFLAAKGISSDQFTTENGANMGWFSSTIPDPYQATFLCVGWYTETAPGSGVFTRYGGHFISVTATGLSGPGQPAPDHLVLNNPAPSTLFNVPDVPLSNPQYARTVQFTGTISGSDPALVSIQFDPSQENSTLSGTSRALIEFGYTIRIDPSDLPAGGWTPATWTLAADTPVINTGGGDLEVLAPLAGAYGLRKTNGGTLYLTGGSNTTSGTNVLSGGGISSNQNTGTPLGTGTVRMEYGTLTLAPKVSGSASAIALTLASGAGSGLKFSGGATLALDPGGNSSLAVTIGDPNQSAAENFQQEGAGTLVIAAATGNASLGSTVQVFVSGSGTVPMGSGMVSPTIVAADNNAAADGDYLTYVSGTGFVVANYTYSGSVGINAATSSMIYSATNNQAVAAGTTASVHAIRVHQSSITSGGANTILSIGSGTSANAGVILNEGQIDTSILRFGSSRGAIYTSNGGGFINSSIETTGGLTTFGPGNLTLTGSSSYTGGTFVQSGTLTVANTAHATGSGEVTVGPGAALVVSGTQAAVKGDITLNSSTLLLEGGTIGKITTTPLSNFNGYGTVTGTAEINGTVGSASTIGTLTFEDAVTFSGNAVYQWTLGSLTSDNTGGVEGVDWSLIQFTASEGIILGPSGSPFTIDANFTRVADPNSGNSFWNSDQQWLIMQSDHDLLHDFNEFNLYFDFPQYTQGYFQWNVIDGGKQVWLYYAAVPEPSAAALAIAGAMGLALNIRRRPRQRLRVSTFA